MIQSALVNNKLRGAAWCSGLKWIIELVISKTMHLLSRLVYLCLLHISLQTRHFFAIDAKSSPAWIPQMCLMTTRHPVFVKAGCAKLTTVPKEHLPVYAFCNTSLWPLQGLSPWSAHLSSCTQPMSAASPFLTNSHLIWCFLPSSVYVIPEVRRNANNRKCQIQQFSSVTQWQTFQ